MTPAASAAFDQAVTSLTPAASAATILPITATAGVPRCALKAASRIPGARLGSIEVRPIQKM